MTGGAVLIRADGGPAIGAGHVMRCLALAEALHEAGRPVAFVSQLDEHLSRTLATSGFAVTPPPRHDLEADARDLVARSDSSTTVVVDGYHLHAAYRRHLQEHGRFVVWIDDLAVEDANADVVLNHHLHARYRDYMSIGGARLLLGPRYALVRREIASRRPAARATPAKARRILVTMGGAVAASEYRKVLQALSALPDADLHVRVARPGGDRFGDLLKPSAEAPFQIDLVDGSDLPALMGWADLAISAAGGTALEMMCLGLPSIKVAIAPNQEGAGAALGREGLCVYLGRASDVTADDIRWACEALIGDAAARESMSRAGMALVDGEGARRVVREGLT